MLDFLTGEGWWFYWPLFGWGIAIIIHAIRTFGQIGPFGPDWEERKAKELTWRDRDRNAG